MANTLILFFFFFLLKKIRVATHIFAAKLSMYLKITSLETFCIKFQILHSGKNKKNTSICRLLKILPRMLSIKYVHAAVTKLSRLISSITPDKMSDQELPYFILNIGQLSYLS